MKASILTSTAPNGSKTYAVVFLDGSALVTIECVDKHAAEQVFEALAKYACYATVADHMAVA